LDGVRDAYTFKKVLQPCIYLLIAGLCFHNQPRLLSFKQNEINFVADNIAKIAKFKRFT